MTPSPLLQKMFSRYWASAHAASAVADAAAAAAKQHSRCAAKRMPLPAAAAAAAAAQDSDAAMLMIDGGRVTKLLVHCNPQQVESVCVFTVVNPHRHLM